MRNIITIDRTKYICKNKKNQTVNNSAAQIFFIIMAYKQNHEALEENLQVYECCNIINHISIINNTT